MTRPRPRPPEVNKGTSRIELLSKWTPLLITTVVMFQAQNRYLKSCSVLPDHYDDEHYKIVFHKTTPELQDQDRFFSLIVCTSSVLHIMIRFSFCFHHFFHVNGCFLLLVRYLIRSVHHQFQQPELTSLHPQPVEWISKMCDFSYEGHILVVI